MAIYQTLLVWRDKKLIVIIFIDYSATPHQFKRDKAIISAASNICSNSIYSLLSCATSVVPGPKIITGVRPIFDSIPPSVPHGEASMIGSLPRTCMIGLFNSMELTHDVTSKFPGNQVPPNQSIFGGW